MSGPSSNGRSTDERATQPSRAPAKLDLDKVRDLSARDVGIRFAFGFAASVVAALMVQGVGSTFGGLFLAFPAILPATTTLLERKSGLAQASADVRGATVGALAMIVYAWVTWRLLPGTNPAVALSAALGAWLLTAAVVFTLMRGLVHVLGENHYLPEIPTTEGAVVLDALRTRSLTVAAAESCTGGLIASYLSSVPDASSVFRGGIVAYDPEVKIRQLDVPAEVLERHGAVSATVAAIMSRNVRRALGADIGVATTGNTGQAGDGKPAGRTYVAVTDAAGTTLVRCYTDDYGPGRNDERAVRMAFKLITDVLDDNRADPHNARVDEAAEQKAGPPA